MAQFFDFEQDYYGLTDTEVEKRLSMYGLNTYKKNELISKNFSIYEILFSPMVILMLIAGVLCFFGFGIGAGIITILIDIMYVLSEIYARKYSYERYDELKKSTKMSYRVIRNGKLELIGMEYIVPEDTIVIQAGERVPVDALLVEARELTVDESALTNSHEPTAKYVGGISKSEFKPNVVYSGSIVLTGIAICKVTATGVDTRLYQHVGEEPDLHPYYTAMERIVRTVVPFAGCVAVAMTFASMIIRLNNEGELLSSILSGLTIGLCFVPVGLCSFIRLNYTKGAMELMNSGATVKSFADIEKLNSLSVLCVEKEGAIAKNHLEVRGIYSKSEELLYRVAALTCEKNNQDPVTQAIMVKASFFNEKIKNVYDENKFIEKIPDSNEVLSGAIWSVGGDKLCCIKGVPDQILPMCKMSGEELLLAKKRCQDYYSKGCTVVAVACVDANLKVTDLTAGFSYMFIGFVAFSAPLRDSVAAAVKTCKRAGVKVVMLTEDNPSTAESTGRMIGISGNKVVTGTQIEAARNGGSPLDLSAGIYAKLNSEQKKYVINQLKNKGEVVAMAGTRVEDADILNTADIGITISQTAVGCVYEEADVIMNDDNFNSVAETIVTARQVHSNIKSGVSVILSGVVSLIVLMIINIFSGSELMLTPPLIALIGMILLPLCALSFWGKELDNTAKLPPSGFVAKRKLNLGFIGNTLMVGLLSGIVSSLTFLFMDGGANVNFARSCAMISWSSAMAAFVFLLHIGVQPIKSFVYSRLIEKVTVCVMLLLPIALVYIPFINQAFGFRGIDVLALFISIVTGVIPAVIISVIKYFFRLKETA